MAKSNQTTKRSGTSASNGRSSVGESRSASNSNSKTAASNGKSGNSSSGVQSQKKSSTGPRSGTNSSATSNEGLMKLFTEQLQDIYYVEKQLIRSLGRMAKAANNDELRMAFEAHKEETETQKERLEEVFEMLDRSPKARKCEAMDGLLEEAKELMEDFEDDSALDAALVAAAQKVEHYEIATYGSLCSWAEQLGLEEAVPLLEETLQEEKKTDQDLTELAVGMLNSMAQQEMNPGSSNSSGSRKR